MGFSTSGSLLVIFFGLILALGSMYTSTSNTAERISESYSDQIQHRQEIDQTEVTITDAIWHTTDGNLTIRVDNVGSTVLSVNATDTLVDGQYRATDDYEIVTVNGTNSDVWALEEQLRLENDTTQPDQIKIVTETGVADTERVNAAGIEFTGYAVSKDYNSNGTNSGIEFNITNTYDDNVTLVDVTVDSTDTTADYINYTKDATPPEARITLEPTLDTPATTADGNFSIGETITTDSTVELQPEQVAQYKLGEFRDETGPVIMLSAEVTVTITYEDPYGVARTLTFTTVVDS